MIWIITGPVIYIGMMLILWSICVMAARSDGRDV